MFFRCDKEAYFNVSGLFVGENNIFYHPTAYDFKNEKYLVPKTAPLEEPFEEPL